MPGIERKSITSPDQSGNFPRARLDVIMVGGREVHRLTLEPGWHFTEHGSPLTGTPTCPEPHLLVMQSGRMKVVMDEGGEDECTPGDVAYVAPGHDAWVVGDEDCVFLDFAPAIPRT
jgi:quercetin dioxygenase-like cupin family protein